ncbi:MAG: PUA domain-containing protein [Nitrososphaerota archaeon]
MKANYLSKKDSARFIEKLKSLDWFKKNLEEKIENVFKIEIDDLKIYKLGKTIILEKNNIFLPTLLEEFSKNILDSLPTLIVDMGAVPHIVNGADVMRPGVINVIGVFREGDLVVVRDQRHGKPIAICTALVDVDSFKTMVKGKVAKNIHYVNDKIWNLLQNVKNILIK